MGDGILEKYNNAVLDRQVYLAPTSGSRLVGLWSFLVLPQFSVFGPPSLREAIMQEKCSFFNIVQKALDPPPIRLNIMCWIFLKEF